MIRYFRQVSNQRIKI